MSMKRSKLWVPASFLAVLLTAMLGCGSTTGQVSEAASPEPPAEHANTELATGAATEAEAAPEVDPAAALAAKEAELARREADIRAKERQQAAVAREAAAKAQALPTVVPAGTELSVELLAAITTKTAKVGDVVETRLVDALSYDGKLVAPAGAMVRATVTEIVSGSHKIGGRPTLGLTFDRLELAGGGTATISGLVVQQGKSDTAKDSAKIAGATVAGAIIGHQVDSDNGKFIGGILGGAAGTAAAQKTGGEVEVPAGTMLFVRLDAPFEIQ